jgi:hypothetical protein
LWPPPITTASYVLAPEIAISGDPNGGTATSAGL